MSILASTRWRRADIPNIRPIAVKGSTSARPASTSAVISAWRVLLPTGSPQEALNIYHRHFHVAKTPEQREAIERIWTARQAQRN